MVIDQDDFFARAKKVKDAFDGAAASRQGLRQEAACTS